MLHLLSKQRRRQNQRKAHNSRRRQKHMAAANALRNHYIPLPAGYVTGPTVGSALRIQRHTEWNDLVAGSNEANESEDGTRVIKWTPKPANQDDYLETEWGHPAIRQFRAAEIKKLNNVPEAPEPGELSWIYSGVTGLNFGPAWSCFLFSLTDLKGAWERVSNILTALSDMCRFLTMDDFRPEISLNSVCMIWFEGETEYQDGINNRLFMKLSPHAMTLRHVINDPLFLLNIVDRYFQSEPFDDFRFLRVFIHVLTNMGGGSLRNLSPISLELRKKWINEFSSFIEIEDKRDNSCGFLAVAISLQKVVYQLIKKEKILNSLNCQGFFTQFKQFNRTSVGKKTKANFNEYVIRKLIQQIGWRRGTYVTPQQLLLAFNGFIQEESLVNQIGLIIFDAIYPDKHNFTSFERWPENKHVPKHNVMVIHWDVMGSSGHYDAFAFEKNLTSWILRGNNRKHQKFHIPSMRMINCYSTSMEKLNDMGNICVYCYGSCEKNSFHSDIILYENDTTYRCEECGVFFPSEQCRTSHRISQQTRTKSACEKQYLCHTCDKIHERNRNCNLFFCRTCYRSVPKPKYLHTCFQQQSKEKIKEWKDNIIYADLETKITNGWHTPVCLAAAYFLYEYGDIYGDVTLKFLYYYGENCIGDFLNYLAEHRIGCTVVFHNGGKFDMQLVYYNILMKGNAFIPNPPIMRGNQIITVSAFLSHAAPVEKKEGKRNKRERQVAKITFIDSLNFLQSSIEKLSDTFELKSKKGMFPYHLMNQPQWETYVDVCPPPSMFGITIFELENLDKLNENRKKKVNSIINYINEYNDGIESKKLPLWNAQEQLKAYVYDDVRILALSCNIFRQSFRELSYVDPFHFCTLPSAVNGALRLKEYMQEDTIQLFNKKDRLWQRTALRGGRTEPVKLFWKKTKPSERIIYVDVNSEYPYVQCFKYFPIGKITCDLQYHTPKTLTAFNIDFKSRTDQSFYEVLHHPNGEMGVGIIECEIELANDVFIPIIPYKDEKTGKNMFSNRRGMWTGFLTLLIQAVCYKQLIIHTVKRLQFWGEKAVSKNIYKKFMAPLYCRKTEASGWDKVKKNITEEEKKQFIERFYADGFVMYEENFKMNSGIRATSKLQLNSAWGFQCQKMESEENFVFDNTKHGQVEEMKDLLLNLETEEKPSKLKGIPFGVGDYTYIKTSKAAEDLEEEDLNKKVAYHLAGQVPAYGLQRLNEGLLALHPSQVVYMDTDSIMYVYDEENPLHKKIQTGTHIGDFTTEEENIVRFISTGPKSYFYVAMDEKGQHKVKGRFKGLPMMSSSYSLFKENGEITSLGMKEMEQCVFNAEKEETAIKFTFFYDNHFFRNGKFQVGLKEEKKTAQFTFDKRQVEWNDQKDKEINTYPWTEPGLNLSSKDVADFWQAVSDNNNKTYFTTKSTISREFPGFNAKKLRT